MRILLDHCTPGKLRRHLPGHLVESAARMGWDQLRNGDLLIVAEKQFDLFVTCDKSIRYQQNLAGRTIAILELGIQSWRMLEPLAAEVAAAVDAMQPGEYRVLF